MQCARGSAVLDLRLRLCLFFHNTDSCLPVAASQNVDDLGDFRALVVVISAIDRLFDAMAYMVAQDFFLGAPQCSPHRRNLYDNVNAIAPFLNHSREATHLTFDAIEALLNGGFGVNQQGSNLGACGQSHTFAEGDQNRCGD